MSREEVQNDIQYPVQNEHLDLVNVCRCADCKYWDSYPIMSGWPDYHRCRMYISLSTSAIDYCSRGERRDEAR